MSNTAYIPGFTSSGSSEAIKKIMEKKGEKLERLEETKDEYKEKNDSLSEIASKVHNVQTEAKNLYGRNSPFEDKVSYSSTEAFSASVTKSADVGEYSINVTKKAEAHRIASDSLSNSYKVKAGNYKLSVGENNFVVKFNGGTLEEFKDEINKSSNDILTSTITNDSTKTGVLLLKGTKPGASNKIGFENENAKKLFKELGFYQDIISFDKRYNLREINMESLTGTTQTPVYGSDDTVRIQREEKYKVNLDQSIPHKEALIMEIDMRLITYDPNAPQEEKKLPTGPDFSAIGDAEIYGINLQGEKPIVEIPPLEQKKPEIKQVIEDDKYLTIVTDRREIELGELDVDKTLKTLKFNLSDIIDKSESITGLKLVNNNTYKDIETNNLRFYDESSIGGINYNREISKPSDAKFQFEGIDIIRDSNIIDDLLPGVTLNIKDETNRNETLQVDYDYEKMVESLESFLANYNELLDLVNKNTQTTTDNDEEKKGIFSGEYSLTMMATKMRHIMMNAYPTRYGRELSMLSQIGISTNASGVMNVDKLGARGLLEYDPDDFVDKFINVMENYPSGVKDLFGIDENKDYVFDTGIAVELERLLKGYTDRASGYFKLKRDNLSTKIEKQDENIEEYKETLEDEEQKLREQFMKMENAQKELEQNSKKFDNFNKQNK